MRGLWLMTLLAALGHCDSAWAFDCFGAGNEAMKAGDPRAAIAAFESARVSETCAAVEDGLLINIAEAYARWGETSRQREMLCRASRTFAQAIEAGASGMLLETARSGEREYAHACEVRSPTPTIMLGPVPSPPPPTPPSPPVLPWALTGGAVLACGTGALLLGLAVDAQTDREAAAERYLAAPHGSQAEVEAIDDFHAAADSTSTLGRAGYVALGLGVALAGGAAWAWWAKDDAHVALTPSGMAIGGAW